MHANSLMIFNLVPPSSQTQTARRFSLLIVRSACARVSTPFPFAYNTQLSDCFTNPERTVSMLLDRQRAPPLLHHFSITSLHPQVQNVDARRHSDLQQRVLKDQQLNPQKACLKEKYACWGGSIMGKCLYSLISHAVTGRTLGCHGESC